MGQSLAEAAVRGVSSPFQLTDEQKALLTEGDIEGLLQFHDSHFKSAVMENDEDEDDSDDDDSDDDDDADDGEDDEDDDDEDDESGDDEDKSKKSKAKKPTPEQLKIQQLTAESKKYRLKNRTHRSTIADLQKQIDELKAGKTTKAKAKDKANDEDESEDNSEELRTSNTKVDQLTRTNEDLLIRLEFMASNKHKWKNPKAALKLLDLSDVEIDEDGDIDGLDEAIDKLAEAEPYLLDTGAEDKADKQRRRKGATGQATGTKQTRKGNPNRDKLLSKYPALRR